MDETERKGFGEPVAGWSPPPRPDGLQLAGRYAVLEPLRADTHAVPLHEAYSGHDRVWDYLPYGPFAALDDYAAWIGDVEGQADPVFLAIRNLDTGRWEGVASYLRITPVAGSIEVGHINLSPSLQRTRAATEAMKLMMEWAFDCGYRRYEWKCDALNIPSRRAAERFGFSFEGVFRQAAIIKGRNRDTAWFAAIDREWPALKQAYTTWLHPDNFDAGGRQILRLGDLTGPVRAASDPVLTSP